LSERECYLFELAQTGRSSQLNDMIDIFSNTETYICPTCLQGLSDGLERIGGEPRGFYGAVDGTAAEREPLGKLSGGEVHRIYRWGKAFDGDGYGLHAENTGPHQGF